jgi:hypothetical protein
MSTAVITDVPTKKGILDHSKFLLIARGYPPLSKTVQSVDLDMKVKTDASMLHHIKDLLKCWELAEIKSNESRIDSFVRGNSHPFPLHKGVYIVPNMLFSLFEEKFEEHVVRRTGLIDKFILRYDGILEEAKAWLGDLYNPANYLPAEQARAAFRFDWEYKNFGPAEDLEKLDKKAAAKQEQKFRASCEDAAYSIQASMRATMKALVDHLLVMLAPSPTGQKRVLKTPAVEGLTEFLRKFPALNIANDFELEALVKTAKELTTGVSRNDLAGSVALRDSMQLQLTQVKSALDQLVQDQPIRGIEFE